ncbi:peptide chain release factor N(5)-glutamine methyltransferase [Kaarinaea lacus]
MAITLPTIKQVLQDAQSRLTGPADTARLDAEILLTWTLDCDRAYLHTWPEKELTEKQQQSFHQLVDRRQKGEPVAYITGHREFWDMNLRVTPDTLIPRPETELLVETALEKIPVDAEWNIADLGTGSGAIALAIGRERPGCQVIATDNSAAALSVARENAKRLDIHNVHFIEGHWFQPIEHEQFEVIVSNPPYVHPHDPHLEEGDLRFEPTQALQSIPDGMRDLRIISNAARSHLVPPGWLILEHGYDQGEAIKTQLMRMGYVDVSVKEDLAQNERICLGKWDKNQNNG